MLVTSNQSAGDPMPLQNRVTPFGEIVAQPWRGAFMGNRGILHDADRQLGRARWRHANWVCCVTEFRGRHRDPMPPGGYTALFFWDEPSSLAAGHRPCAECRNTDWRRFREAWTAAGLPGVSAAEIDRALHRARVTRERRQVTHAAELADLPESVFVTRLEAPDEALLIWQGRLWRWSAEGYADAGPRTAGPVSMLTPMPTVAVLRAGYQPAPPAVPLG
jgi:hypothetical protein